MTENNKNLYYIKYLKYKQKYISLRKKMTGGGGESKNERPSVINTPLFSCYYQDSFDRLITTANDNNLLIDSIDNLDNWDIKSLDSVEFKIYDDDIKIDFEMLHYGDKSDINPIFIIPGFSNSSLTMTVGRINRFKNTILEKGYSDIYIMNNTSIGKLPNNLANKGVSFPTTYQAICNNISSYFDSYEKVTLLGRSAGGGIAMYLAFKFISEKVIGLNLACPGYDMSDMGTTIDSFKNKNLPIRVSWANSDTKIVENIENVSGGQSLKERFEKNNYTNFKYYQVEGLLEEGPSIEGKNKHINTHRIQPILIDNLV